MFTELDRKWKIFRRSDGQQNTGFIDFATRPPHRPPVHESAVLPKAERWLMNRFIPPSAIVDKKGDIAYIHGRTGEYLEPASGQPRLNILDMAREGLRSELTSALHRVADEGNEIILERILVKTNGETKPLTLSVLPIKDPEGIPDLYLVSFRADSSRQTPRPVRIPARQASGVQTLERELRSTKETLQVTIEELETSNEELKSTNEELQSANEELQSTNEELETSKEEMQSLYEELTTVNSELQAKLNELTRTQDDMRNLLNSTDVAILFLDNELRIKLFTEQVRGVIKIIESDLARPFGDLVCDLTYDDLIDDTREVLRTLVPKETEAQTSDGTWFLVRIRPYRTAENLIAGAVLVFVDINQTKLAEQETRRFLEDVLQTVTQPLVVLDETSRVHAANPAFYQAFGVRPARTQGELLYEIGEGQWDLPELRYLVKNVLPKKDAIDDVEVVYESRNTGRRILSLKGRRLSLETAGQSLTLLTIDDITDRKKVAALE